MASEARARSAYDGEESAPISGAKSGLDAGRAGLRFSRRKWRASGDFDMAATVAQAAGMSALKRSFHRSFRVSSAFFSECARTGCARSQRYTMPSAPPDARTRPLGENATDSAVFRWPSNVA